MIVLGGLIGVAGVDSENNSTGPAPVLGNVIVGLGALIVLFVLVSVSSTCVISLKARHQDKIAIKRP